jgi:hypothetical protein
MKKFKLIRDLSKIDPNEIYFYWLQEYERFGPSEVQLRYGTGQQVIKQLNEQFDYEFFLEDRDAKDTPKMQKLFLKWLDTDGDGDDFVQVFKMPKN